MAASTIRLLISCPDARGIIANVANFVAGHNGNILDADQHTDPQRGEFFMRLEIDPKGFDLDAGTFAAAWEPLARSLQMRWRVFWGEQRKRMALLVSRQDHCLQDLLWRWKTGELRVDLPIVIGNHADLAGVAEGYGVRFAHVSTDASDRSAAEGRILALLRGERIDLVVLARYMQILSPAFVGQYREHIINIHHSFLPAFAGAKPYHQAFDRGVKIIGATSHYVTEQLDDGPIIAQSTQPVDHRDTIEDLIRKGRDLERMVLATAVRLHAEDRILVNGNKTVVFD